MKSLVKIRREKMAVQGGRCFYCTLPMWDEAEARSVLQVSSDKKSRLLPALRCTAEHLQAASEGGKDLAENIVAACFFCNQSRHRTKQPLTPEAHRHHVQKRMAAGQWLMPLAIRAKIVSPEALRRPSKIYAEFRDQFRYGAE